MDFTPEQEQKVNKFIQAAWAALHLLQLDLDKYTSAVLFVDGKLVEFAESNINVDVNELRKYVAAKAAIMFEMAGPLDDLMGSKIN